MHCETTLEKRKKRRHLFLSSHPFPSPTKGIWKSLKWNFLILLIIHLMNQLKHRGSKRLLMKTLWVWAWGLWWKVLSHDGCSCSLPSQPSCCSGKCDAACFTAQDAPMRHLLVMYSGQAVKWTACQTIEMRVGHTHKSSVLPISDLFLFLCVCVFHLCCRINGALLLFSSCPCLSSRYRHTISLGSVAIMCGFCKPPQSLEATKGCADCKSNFCNECFKLYHPWGTPRAQHEHILPTNNFRPKVCLL